MAPVTQILLIISYAILGLAMVLVPPKLFGMGQDLANFLGIMIFFGAWQIQNWLVNGKIVEETRLKVEHLEDVAHMLRKDLERTRREVETRGRVGDEKNELLVSELKVLQTLLSQVSRKELELKGEAIPAEIEAPEEEAMTLSADHVPEHIEQVTEQQVESAEGGEELELVPSSEDEEASASEDIEVAAELEDLELTPEEAAMVVVDDGGSLPDPVGVDETSSKKTAQAGANNKAAAVRRKAPIRIIKREDQLLSVVRDSLSENRVDLYLQPIVGLPSRRVVHYECFSRVRDEDGRIILPRQYLKVAESKGLIGTIDNLLLFRLIQLVRRLGKRRPDLRFFCNMSRYSMADEEFFPQFVDFMTANEEFSRRLVFEISQEDFNSLEDDVHERLMSLGRKGFAFSMDMVSEFDQQDFAALEGQYFRFIKSDLRDLQATHPDDNDIEDFKSFLRRKSMQLIASRIESEEKVLQTLDLQIEFAQGYLFGEPAAATELNREL